MTADIITPKGSIVISQYGHAELKWNTNFRQKWNARYSKVQTFVDSEVLRLCEPFVPLRTGMLVMSGILGTEIGSGWVQWIAPYAKRQYYNGRVEGVSSTGPLRGRFWFERMKMIHRDQIIKGAKKAVAGDGK